MSLPILLINDPMGDPMDLTADAVSSSVNIKQAVGYCISTLSTGDAIGVLSLQISMDDESWFDLVGTELAVDGTGACTNVWNIERAMYPFVRLSFVYTSGATGECTAVISSKSA